MNPTDLLVHQLLREVPTSALVVDQYGQAHAHVRIGKSVRLLRLRGQEFKLWLAHRMLTASGAAPRPAVLSRVILALQSHALALPRVPLWNRVAHGADGAIWLDLCDPSGGALRVDQDGVRVIAEPPPLFHRYAHQEPLPLPDQRGDLWQIFDLLNIKDDADRALFLCSLVAALRPDIPQPLLLLFGPQGAAKTTAARLRRALVDPSSLPTVIVRHDAGELALALEQHYMPVLDNLGALSGIQEDLLCQAATGGGFTKRALYSDQDAVIFRFRRPLILTGIDLPSAAPDLLDRCLLFDLERVPPEQRRDEASLWQSFQRERPRLLFALLLALSQAMRRVPAVDPCGLTRMADFGRWAAAAAPSFGLSERHLREALHDNVARQGHAVVDQDPLAAALCALLSERGSFSGTPSELLEVLSVRPGRGGLPRHAAVLGRRLQALRAPLSALGVSLRSERAPGYARQRRWLIEGPPRSLDAAPAGALRADA